MTDTIGRLSTALAERYRVERELGAGGMATVYLANDLKHDRKVAVKVLHPELGAVIGADRFLQEIKTTARLQHPHILGLIDSGEADGLLYYVMPFVSGESLRQRLTREKHLPIPDALRIAFEVASALDYAHRQGVVHRDIKPENVLLHDGQALVADFGIALAVTAAGGGRLTQTGMSLGTPHYMSPEQALGEKEVTSRSDIYALGAMTYEMLTGEPPFTGSTAQQVLAKVMTEKPLPPSATRETVAPHVEAAVLVALAKLPADRWGTAREFADALANPSNTAAIAIATRTVPVTVRGVPRAVFLATAAVAVLGIAVAAWGWLRPRPIPEVRRFSVAFPAATQVSLQGAILRLALSPDGRKLVYVGDVKGTTQLFLRRLEDLSPQPIPGTEGAVNPSFSPDSKRLAFVGGSPRALKIISLSGGPPQTLTDSMVDLGGVSWGADGYIYYDAHFEGDGLARIKESGGEPEIASRPLPDESWHASPSALPSGKGVLFTIARGRGANPFDLAVLDTRTGKHRVLLRGVGPQYAGSGHLLYALESGSLMAVRFDAERLTTTGEPLALAEGVAIRGLGRADLAIASNGLLAYVAGASGGRVRELAWVTRDGRSTPVDSSWRVPMVSRPALSPDGKSVTVALNNASRNEVWVKQLDAGPASKLTDAGISPNWSRDGREVVFYGNGGVSQGPADGSVAPTLRFRHGDAWTFLEYSPDGQWVIGTLAGDVAGVRMAVDTTPVTLVGGRGTQRRATISPDGHWLAYESDEDGGIQVYVRPFPATQTAKRQISTSGGILPRWSRDGRELFYVNETLQVIAVPVSLNPTFSAGVPHSLFRADGFALPALAFDVHPDGKRFLFVRALGGEGSSADQLIVTENIFEELKAKLP